jgi:hypothetical protein
VLPPVAYAGAGGGAGRAWEGRGGVAMLASAPAKASRSKLDVWMSATTEGPLCVLVRWAWLLAGWCGWVPSISSKVRTTSTCVCIPCVCDVRVCVRVCVAGCTMCCDYFNVYEQVRVCLCATIACPCTYCMYLCVYELCSCLHDCCCACC